MARNTILMGTALSSTALVTVAAPVNPMLATTATSVAPT
jgi:hypothetical protein